MRSSSVAIIVVVLGLVCAAAAFGLWRSHGSGPAPDRPETASSTSVPVAPPSAAVLASATAKPTPATTTALPQPNAPPPRTLRTPPEFPDFETWPSERQLNAITDIQRNPHLSPAMRDFLVDLASDPSRRAVMRNNAANALGVQDPPVSGWLGKLADQALDPAETPIWRDYALQHLADQLVPRGEVGPPRGDFIGSPDSGLDRQRYIAVLASVAASNKTIAGTALLHLDRLSRERGVSIDRVEFRALILRVLQGNDVDVGAKVTAFGILGMRGDVTDAAIARQYLKDGDADVRRSAVAALGLLGTDADIAAIEAVEVGGDPSVEMAKKAACKRLSERRASQTE